MGGISAAILTVPVSIGYGILALAPLGPEYIAHGVLAGLYAVVCGGLIALLLGANTSMIYAPRSIITFLMGSLVLQSLVLSTHETLGGLDPRAHVGVVVELADDDLVAGRPGARERAGDVVRQRGRAPAVDHALGYAPDEVGETPPPSRRGSVPSIV